MAKVKKLDLGTQIESTVEQIQHGGSTYDPNKKISENGVESDSDSLQGSDGASPFLASDTHDSIEEIATEATTPIMERILSELSELQKMATKLTDRVENAERSFDRIEGMLMTLLGRKLDEITFPANFQPGIVWPLGPDDPREYYIGDVPNSPFEVGDTPETTSPQWVMPPAVTANPSPAIEFTFGSKADAERYLMSCSGSHQFGTPQYNAAVEFLYGPKR